ncbi:MAG: hypothetical protein HQK91_01035 [Nitrospirae bacterium]|nr:hypothetical protein [Nitrospirota bacterium]
MDQTNIKLQVWTTIQNLNRLWTVENNADELKNYFHKNMVAISPTDKLRLEGRDACVASWKNFTQISKINYWKEIDPKIEIFGDNNLAIVTYYFDMSFEISG